MRGLSIRWKITIWFSTAILLMMLLTMLTELAINEAVIQKEIQDTLVEIVEDNVDEVEFCEGISWLEWDLDKDLYLDYKDGYLEIDDDYLDVVHGVYTALYEEDGTLLYGENPVGRGAEKTEFSDGSLQTAKKDGEKYYIYDRRLEGDELESLWLRGVVSKKQGTAQISSILWFSLILLPALGLLSVLGGYWIADRALRPIKQIRDTANSIREGDDFTRRIQIGEGKDELHSLANAFDAMFDRIEAVFQLQQKFTSDASHELRTPITVILSQCEYALAAPQSQEEYREALELIGRQGKKMSALVNDLLDVTRLEQRKGQMERECVDLSALAASICQDMALIREKGISLESSIEENIFVYGNAGLLTKLLNNLISNAYRYGRQEGHIYVELAEADGEVQLSVADDGIGIEEEKLPLIWNRFYQADASRGSKGAGLGLSIVKEIALLHQGNMTADSVLGEGSVFILHLGKMEKEKVGERLDTADKGTD